MVFRVLAFFMLLGWAAMYDWKKREVPDLITACLWVVVILSLELETIAAISMAFATMFLLNTFFYNTKGRTFWGWGDILIFPPFFAQLYAWGQPILATLALLLPFLIGGIWNKEEEAVVPYLFVGAVIAFFFP